MTTTKATPNRKGIKKIGTLLAIILASGVAIGYCSSDRQDLSDTDRGDSAFIEDLARVWAVAKQRTETMAIEPTATDLYINEQIERYVRFSKFAKEKILPHSRKIAAGRKDPDLLLKAGEARLAEEKDSWEGHDFVAAAKLFKQDSAGAKESYLKALAGAPTEMRGWYKYMIGVAALMGKDQKQALEWMDKAIEDNNNWAAVKSAHLNKASILLAQGSFEKAAANLNTYFAMARGEEIKLVSDSPICKMTISAGFKVGGCEIK